MSAFNLQLKSSALDRVQLTRKDKIRAKQLQNCNFCGRAAKNGNSLAIHTRSKLLHPAVCVNFLPKGNIFCKISCRCPAAVSWSTHSRATKSCACAHIQFKYEIFALWYLKLDVKYSPNISCRQQNINNNRLLFPSFFITSDKKRC